MSIGKLVNILGVNLRLSTSAFKLVAVCGAVSFRDRVVTLTGRHTPGLRVVVAGRAWVIFSIIWRRMRAARNVGSGISKRSRN